MKLWIHITKDGVWKVVIRCVDILKNVFVFLCITMVEAFIIFDQIFGVCLTKTIWLGFFYGGLWFAMILLKVVLNIIRKK